MPEVIQNNLTNQGSEGILMERRQVILVAFYNKKALGVRYLEAALERAGYLVTTIFYKDFNSVHPQPSTRREMELFLQVVREKQPLLVGLSVMSSMYLDTVYQLMDGRDVMVTHDRILCLLELVPSESEDRLLAVIAVYYLIKARCITRDMIEIGTVGFLLNPGYCGDMEQFCLLRLLLLTLFVFHEEISIDYHAVIARVAQVMRIVPETLFRCLLRDLYKLCSVESEYFIAMFHLSTWNIIAFCFNHSRSGVLVQRTRKLKQLATRFLIELPRDEAELWRRQLSSIRIETIIWMLWTDDHRD